MRISLEDRGLNYPSQWGMSPGEVVALGPDARDVDIVTAELFILG